MEVAATAPNSPNTESIGEDSVLTPAARQFVERLQRHFGDARAELLSRRQDNQRRYDDGELPQRLKATEKIRISDWKVAAIPESLLDRRVELTGPVDRKTLINGLNSPARVYMADFEDSTSPTRENIWNGHQNLIDAVRREIEFRRPADGKIYRLADRTATLMVRPRGLHLPEKNLKVDGADASAMLFDLGLFLFHNAVELAEQQQGPYLYIPKLESYQEAEWLNSVLADCEVQLGLNKGTIRVTVLIETLPACLQMDEILHALRDRVLALNCGRWDYIFSYIKTLRKHSDRVLPERGQVGMGVPFLSAYSRHLVQTCHRRGAMAMGGMAAQIPVRGDDRRNALAFERVQADKQREVANGHDGTWIAHPGLHALALAAFEDKGVTDNQLPVRHSSPITEAQLLACPDGTVTEQGVQSNAAVSIEYLGHWLNGTGCVPINYLMEDAATAEIARTQLWQWAAHGRSLPNGRKIDFDLIEEALVTQGQRMTDVPRVQDATAILRRAAVSDLPADFITTIAYDFI